MAKAAIIGTGSLVFCKTLINDFLATPALAGSEYSLMALTHTRLDKVHFFVDRMIKDNGIEATVTKTTDRRGALRDADYVVVMIRVVSEMLEAQRQWLPQFGGETVRPMPKVEIPENVEPVEVPLDPALAIANRFRKLAEV